MVSGSDWANIPGPPGSPTSGRLPYPRSAAPGTRSHSLAASGCQVTMQRRPFGLRWWATLVNAAVGSEKNIVPKRLIATSKVRRGGRSGRRRARTKRFRSRRSGRGRRRRRSIGADRSTPVTTPLGPVTWAAAMVVAPQPQPMSSTRSSGVMAAWWRSRSAMGHRTVSRRSASATQCWPLSPFQASNCSALVRAVTTVASPCSWTVGAGVGVR